MKIKFLLRNWSSVSAAAAALVGASSRAPASQEALDIEKAKLGGGDPYEPLILKPPAIKVIPEQRFAGHVSHASHASHASHYSGSGNYQPPATTPAPTATPTYSPPSAVVYPSAAPATSQQSSASTSSLPSAGPSRIELVSGTIFYGTVLTKSAAGITLRGWDGKNYKFERTKLSARTIAELGLPTAMGAPNTKPTGGNGETSDAAGLSQKNEELEQTIAALRADNAALREQLRAVAARPNSTAPTQARASQPVSANPSQQDATQAYWLSGTGKRHNKNCRYYGTGSGHPCGPNDGVPCKICGG
jgi:hypothetical protein